MPALPFKLNQDRRHHIPEQKRKVTNWRDYDESLRRRSSLTVWFSDEAVEAWEAERRTSRGGQPEYSDLAILTALTFKAVFRLAYRQTEGLIGSVIGLLGLDLAVSDHTTLCRRAETLEVPRPKPRGDGADSGAGRDTGPMHLLVDSTGLKLYGAGEWLVEKHGTKRRRSWRKLHLGVDAETGRIVAATLTDRDEDDASQVGPLLDQVEDPVASFTADGAYDQESVYADVAERHPRRTSSFRRARPPCPAPRPRPRRRSGTATCNSSPRRAEWAGRRPRATMRAPGPRPPSAGSSA
jgi:hypothetical protein